jgi:hypothetical protein
MNEDRLMRIENKIDKVVDHIGKIDTTLAAQHESLKTHIHRTELLEEAVKPLVKHDNMLQGILKLIGVLALIGAAAEGAVALLNYLKL